MPQRRMAASTKDLRSRSCTTKRVNIMESGPSKAEHEPFHFNTSAHLLRIGRERASNLAELLQALRACSENSVFQHTFRTLQEHHFLREGFSNDFAHWALS